MREGPEAYGKGGAILCEGGAEQAWPLPKHDSLGAASH